MTYPYQNEKKLIKDIHEGDPNAYKYVFDLYYADLCKYVTNFTLDPDIAEDIVQNSFVSLWRRRKKLLFIISLKSYLYKSCYNGYIDFYRKNKKVNEHLEKLRYIEIQNIQKDFDSDPEKWSSRGEKLKIAVENLPEKCRKIFIMSKYNGLKYKEIAEELDLSVKTVENQIGIAIKRLRKELKE